MTQEIILPLWFVLVLAFFAAAGAIASIKTVIEFYIGY